MASTLAIASSDALLQNLFRSFPSIFPKATSVSGESSKLTTAGSEIDGSNTIAAHFAQNVLPDYTYSTLEKAEISQWLTLSSNLGASLNTLNEHLATRTTLLGSKPSLADYAVYSRAAPIVKGWGSKQRLGNKNLVRFIDYVQNAPLYGLKVDKIDIDVDTKAEEKPSLTEKAKEVVAAVLPKKEKKEKEKKPAKPQKAPATVIAPHLIDLRVGHILKAVPHPNADSLFVSTIACGDAAGSDIATTNGDDSEFPGTVTRTVCSGLNGLIPIEEMQNRKVVVVCNLKPVTMRGVKSAAMVLAASPRDDNDHKGPVELVSPPADAQAGERVYFEGWQGEPEAVLNPKKKVWETVQPGFTTTESLEVKFDSTLAPTIPGSGPGILRTKEGASLSAIKLASLRIYNIRANRPRGGLKKQHLVALEWLRETTAATVEGNYVGSKSLVFEPQRHGEPEDVDIDAGTGAVTLVLQTILPYILFRGWKVKVRIRGGTNTQWAPSVDYLEHVFIPMLGAELSVTSIRGWSVGAQGAGVLELQIGSISPRSITAPQGDVSRVLAFVHAPQGVHSEIKVNVPFPVEYHYQSSKPKQFYVLLVAEGRHRIGVDWLYDRKIRDEAAAARELGKGVSRRLMAELEKGHCIDEHLHDQLVVFQALYGIAVEREEESLHTQTAKWVAKELGFYEGGVGAPEGSAVPDGRPGGPPGPG